ncbi:MAG: TonB-dependent receptor [Opitutae bacterium]|nr:TonB-dependent receptor [Opitutae bacterium]
MNQPRSVIRGAAPRLLASALALSFVSAFAQTSSTDEPEKKDNTVKMEAFSVTGSRIKRIDDETPQPVVRLTEADFKATGFSTLGDALRAMPAASGSSLNPIASGTSFTPGVNSFNLRGLGNNNTLVLINGRRAAPFASAGFNGFQSVFDFNSIPASALESLEVLKDGASAIYGSDAVAGVVNIKLKKNYTGFATELSFGNTFGTDSNERSGFLMFGTHHDKTSVMMTFDIQRRASLYARDLSYARSADGSTLGGLDQRSTSTPIAGVRGLTGLPQFPNGRATFLTPQTNPTLANAVNATPLYDFNEDQQWTPETFSYGFYSRGSYDFSDALSAFAEVSFRRSRTGIDSAPVPYVALQELGDAPSGLGMMPANNPYNPFGQPIFDLRWRMRDLGNRLQDVIADSPRMVFGLEGKIPGGDWTWEGALNYSKNTVTTLSTTTSDRLVQNALNGVTIDGVLKYANPFGPNDPAVIKYLRIVNPNYDEFEVRGADFSASGPLFNLPAGAVEMAGGLEMRTERMKNIGTALNRESQIVGGSTGSDTYGDRRLYSAYAELNLPVLKNSPAGSLEMQLAGRFESYSDFGETTKPKAALVWRPVPEVLVRGSYGESFLAPNLAFLYTTQSVSFTSNTLADPLRPNDPRVQIRQFGGGNPNLQPENTKVYYLGVVVQPFARSKDSPLRELSFSADYYKFNQSDLINRPSASTILTNPGIFGHLILRNPPVAGETVGTISGVVTTWQNISRGEYEGYDFNVRWVSPKYHWGKLRVDLSATYLDNYEQSDTLGNLLDGDADYLFPLLRGNATLAWSKGDWAASLFVNYVGPYTTIGSGIAGLPDVKRQVTLNPQISYRGFMNCNLTLGVRNALNSNPPLDLSSTSLVNTNGVNSTEPAFWYFRIGREF